MISDKIKRLLEVTKEENARLLKKGRVTEDYGILYFKEPLKIIYTDWIYNHLSCDAIVSEFDGNYITIVCYAKSEQFNYKLRKLKQERYPDYKVFQGFSKDMMYDF